MNANADLSLLAKPTEVQVLETIAARLRRVRHERGRTRNQVRQAIGYNFDTYAATEDGRRLPQPIELPALALYLAGPGDAFVAELAALSDQLQVERAARRTASYAHTAEPIAPGAA